VQNPEESRWSIKPRSRASRSSPACANRYLRAASKAVHASAKRFLP
jgi:hypothetical protein